LDRRRFFSRALATFLLVGATAVAEKPAKKPAFAGGPPFDLTMPTPHHITMTIDTEPARDVLALITSASPDAASALHRLKSSAAAAAAIRSEDMTPDDFFGKLVAAASGTPNPAFASLASKAPFFGGVLDAMDGEGAAAAAIEGGRIASLLPTTPAVTARLVVVPSLGISGFGEVTAVREGDTIYLVAELARLTADALATPPPRETLLKTLRSCSSEAWRTLFQSAWRKLPAWSDEKTPDVDALLARTVAEGPATLFLVPDEFFPISAVLGDPIARSWARWNRAVDGLLDPKKKESEKRDILAESTRGEFWGRHGAIVGMQITDALLRLVGRDAYLKALQAGPRAVATLYMTAAKGSGLPEFGKAAKKVLETRPPSS
jgi:hypothetical protein